MRYLKLFAACTPGLEPFTSHELRQLKLPLSPYGENECGNERGGVEFEGSLIDVYRCNLHLRTASRLLVRFGSFYSVRFPELRRKAGNLPWEDYLKVGKPVAIRVTCHKSRLYHQRAVAERIADAISERLKSPVQIDTYHKDTDTNPPQLILVRLLNDHCTISIDSSGKLLHRRGYRLAVTNAPLRETMAAAMVLASGWDGNSSLLDPFCGSGTIPIEAALMARQIPPGRKRLFAFMDWPNFKEKAWDALLQGPDPNPQTPFPRIIASDRDTGAIRAAQTNAERAGVFDCIEFSCHAISSIDPPSGQGWIITNPPYGVRTNSNRDLRNLYAQIGKILRQKCPRWQVTLLSNSQLLCHTGLQFYKEISLINGGIKVKLATGAVQI